MTTSENGNKSASKTKKAAISAANKTTKHPATKMSSRSKKVTDAKAAAAATATNNEKANASVEQQAVAPVTEESVKATVTVADDKDAVSTAAVPVSSSSLSSSSSFSANSKSGSSAAGSSSNSGDGVAQNEEKRTGTYPLITLRSIIITPSANVQLIAARENTVLALQEALHGKQDIAVFSQLTESDLRPSRDDLGRVGVLAKVLNGSYNDKEQYRATIRGYERIIIRRIIDKPSEQVRHVEVEFLKEVEVDPVSQKRYIDAVRAALDNALEMQQQGGRSVVDKSIPPEMITAIRDVTSLGNLTDGLAQILMLAYFDKKYILECVDPIARAKAIIAFLNNFSYKAEVDKKIAEDARAAMDRSQRDFYLAEQLKAIKRELNLGVDDSSDIEEYRQKISSLDATTEVVERLQKEVSRLSMMPMNTGENSMVRNYIDTLLSIPWRKSSMLNTDLNLAKEILDQDHYGLHKVKDRILEFLAVQTRRDRVDPHGQILCLMGPPGIGKTSLANSIAKATGRKYVRVALGGMYDESEIRGHRRTYIGAMPGRIIQSMIKCGVDNPLFLLDEIDKISTNNYHGDISAALLEVLDPEQNKSFSDNYVDVDYDLSKVFFICTANSYSIPPALRDRMEIIDLSSYTADEKFHIAREHLLPKQIVKNALSTDEFDITDDGIRQLILHYTMEAGVRSLERIIAELCRKTVKEMMLHPEKSAAEAIAAAGEKDDKNGEKTAKSKGKAKADAQEAVDVNSDKTDKIDQVDEVVVSEIPSAATSLDGEDAVVVATDQVVPASATDAVATEATDEPKSKVKKVQYPEKFKKVVLGVKEIEKLIGPKRYDYTSKLKDNRVGVVNGLSVSSVGGDMLQVEVVANEGKGSHLLTGQLGSVMKESVFAAIAWVRSHAREFSLAPDFYQYVDLNVHFPEGAIKKDGPSAGSATTTAIVSALTGNAVRSDVAMTGEITLRGDVLAIGGLKEKLLAALRGGVKTVCIPHENEKDLWDIPENVTTGLKIVPVKTIDEVLDIALVKKPSKFKPTTNELWTLKGYEEREKKRKLRDEAEERKFTMEIKDASESGVKSIKNNNGDAEDGNAGGDDASRPRRRRREMQLEITK